MKKKLVIFFRLVNVPRFICDHLVGELHTRRHRQMTGIFLISVGVAIMHITQGVFIIEDIGLGIGGGIHAVGLIPFIDSIDVK